MQIDRTMENEMIENRKQELRERLEYGPVTCRHFKGNYYEVLGIAKHTEDGYELAIYRTKYSKEEKIWARPLDMFLSYIEEKDVTTYPDALYRMTFSEDIMVSKEQEEKIASYIEQSKDRKHYVRSLRGDIYKIFAIARYPEYENSTVFVKDLLNGQNIISIPASELFTDNYQFIDGVTHEQLVDASNLSERITCSRFMGDI